MVAPELAVPGKTTAVLVTLHGPTRPVNITLRLMGDGAEELNQQLVETTQEITGIRDKVNLRPRPYSRVLENDNFRVLNQVLDVWLFCGRVLIFRVIYYLFSITTITNLII